MFPGVLRGSREHPLGVHAGINQRFTESPADGSRNHPAAIYIFTTGR